MTDANSCAFPHPNYSVFGLTKREYMATLIYSGLATTAERNQPERFLHKTMAELAVACADALIKTLNGEPQ